MLKLLQWERKDLNGNNISSSHFKAQRLLLLGRCRRLKRNAGCLQYPAHRHNVDLGFRVNWNNYISLNEKKIILVLWNTTHSSIILLDILTSDLSRHLKSLMSHTQNGNVLSYYHTQRNSKHPVTAPLSSTFRKTSASKNRLQLLSRSALSSQPHHFTELLSQEVHCANRNFAHWRKIFDTCDSPEPSSSKKKRTMVPSAWPDRIPFPDTLQINRCKVAIRFVPLFFYPWPEEPVPGTLLMLLIKGTFTKDKLDGEQKRF